MSAFKLEDLTLTSSFIISQAADIIHVTGYNSDVDTAADEDVWGFAATFPNYPYQSTAETVQTSGAATDTAAGANARTVTITGLDANWNRQTETITMNGVSVVVTTGTWLRIFSARVATTGSSETNSANLGIDGTTSGERQAWIPAGENFSRDGVYTVPADYYGYVLDVSASARETPGDATVFLQSRPSGAGFGIEFELNVVQEAGHKQHVFTIPPRFDEQTDLRLRATVGTDNTPVHASFTLALVPK